MPTNRPPVRKDNRPVIAVSSDLNIGGDRFFRNILDASTPPRVKKPLRLCQGQVWKQGEEYFRIVRLERREVEYKSAATSVANKGTHHTVSKKEFCRLLKNATLLARSETLPAPTTAPIKPREEG